MAINGLPTIKRSLRDRNAWGGALMAAFARTRYNSPIPAVPPFPRSHAAMFARSLFVFGLVPALALAQVPPEKAVSTMTVADGLQIELFASEPMLVNPTSIDVDHLGRVWVCEAVNYRRVMFNRPILRPEGDRIVILEDSKGVGKADKATTFYQGKEIIAPIGICVAPIANGKPGACKVFVCQ